MLSTASTSPAAAPPAAPDALWRGLRDLPPRERYAEAALAALPRLLGLVDRNPLSRTYGCFDRAFWHYRTMDFPCGMSQEMVLPLALAWAWRMPGGAAYYRNERLRGLVVAAMHYARRSSHADGTCDDYFPFERAMGALVFSLYAMTDSCLVLGLHQDAAGYDDTGLGARPDDDFPALLEFFARRGDHLIGENETGQLANHQALAALALYNVYLLTGEERFRRASNERRDLTLAWQHAEGWFQEYEGADPGYHSCSIDFLGKLLQKSGDVDVLEAPLRRAADFAWYFMHPDGSYAGEYGSRNTYHFYPHGFELLAAGGHERSAQIADGFLERGLPGGARYFNDDDRMCAHYVYNWMQAWHDFAPMRAESPLWERPAGQAPERRWFPAAGLAVAIEAGGTHIVANARKGGVVKAVGAGGPWLSDTGPMVRLADGTTYVAHLMKPADAEAQSFDAAAGELRSSGTLDRRKHQLPNPWTQILFRLATLTVGRFNANFVRSTLQKILITGKRPSSLRFERRVRLGAGGVEIEDRLENPERLPVEDVVFAPDTTSIYVANSNTFQHSALLPALALPEAAEALSRAGRVTIRRRYETGRSEPASLEISQE